VNPVIVEQIWTGNAYRNFNYLIACPETGEALAVDPARPRACLRRAKERGWTITQIAEHSRARRSHRRQRPR
jgi:hydroxyacylglutathione hydrolase